MSLHPIEVTFITQKIKQDKAKNLYENVKVNADNVWFF